MGSHCQLLLSPSPLGEDSSSYTLSHEKDAIPGKDKDQLTNQPAVGSDIKGMCQKIKAFLKGFFETNYFSKILN